MNWQAFYDELYRRLTESEKARLKDIRKEYQKVVREIMSELGALYGSEETLTVEQAVDFYRLREFAEYLQAQAGRLGKQNREAIEKLMDESYDMSYMWLAFGVERAVNVALDGATPYMTTVLALNRQNALDKLRLDSALELSRNKIVQRMQEAFEDGIYNGRSFHKMADNVQKVFEMDYNRALMIAETEVHRVRELGSRHAAESAYRQGLEIEKVWMSMGDERVRRTRKANHVLMDGQRKGLKEPFVFFDGITTDVPGNSGTPQNDIRCRCIARYEVVGVRKVGVAESQQGLTRQFNEWKKQKGIT